MSAYPLEAGHVKGSETSRAAADFQNAGDFRLSKERVIYDLIAAKAQTRLDVQQALGWKIQTVTARIAEMKARGLLGETGRKITQEGFDRAELETIAPYAPPKAASKPVSGRKAYQATLTALKSAEATLAAGIGLLDMGNMEAARLSLEKSLAALRRVL